MIDYTLDAGCTNTSYANCEVWAHQNRLGSVVATTDSSGAVIDKYTYSSYGVSGAEGNSGFPFRFTGQKLDPETGLYYYKARFYDPETGRFLQTDPIGYADQMNLYAYVGNDPVNLIDPSGRMEEEIECLVQDDQCGGGGTVDEIDEPWRETGEPPPSDHNNPPPEGPPPVPPLFPAYTPDGTPITKHGLEQLDDRGIPSSVVDMVLTSSGSVSASGDGDTTVIYNRDANITVVISNESGAVVTAHRGLPNTGRTGTDKIMEQVLEQIDADVRDP